MEACERTRWCLGTTTKPTCNVNRLLGATGHTAVSALQLGELDQGLALEGHHHHVTTRHEQQRELPVTRGWTSSCSGSGGGGRTGPACCCSHHMVPNFSRASIRSASTTASQRPRTCTTGLGEIRWDSPSLSCNTPGKPVLLTAAPVTAAGHQLADCSQPPSVGKQKSWGLGDPWVRELSLRLKQSA